LLLVASRLGEKYRYEGIFPMSLPPASRTAARVFLALMVAIASGWCSTSAQSTPVIPTAGAVSTQLPTSLSAGLYNLQLGSANGLSSNVLSLHVVANVPTITGIHGVPTLGQAITIDGSGFEDNQGAGFVRLVGSGVPDISIRDIGLLRWSNQQIVFTLSSVGGNYRLQVHTDSNGDSAPFSLSVAAPSIISVVNGVNALTPFETPAEVLTHRYNNKRTGANLREKVLTVESVSSSDFQKLYTIPIAGQVYAQPLIVPQLRWTDGTVRNVLIVATMNNQVSAFQVDDSVRAPAFAPVLLWQNTLAPSVPGNFMAMTSSAIGLCAAGICLPSGTPSTPAPLPPVGTSPTVINRLGFYNINPSIGIVSTPAIDVGHGRIYVVCKDSNNGDISNDLFALDLFTGAVLRSSRIGASPGIPVGSALSSVAGSASDGHDGKVIFNETHQMQRPALLLQDILVSPGVHQQRLYVAFGSHQDTRPWHGWIFSYDPQSLEQKNVWCSTPNGMGGSIWQAGNGIAGADDGSIYVMTGNGDEDPEGAGNWKDSINPGLSNFAEHFVKLNQDLVVQGNGIAPNNALEMDAGDEDLDLGSSGPVLFPEQVNGNILFGGGKDSRLVVLDSSTMLGIRQVFQAGKPHDFTLINTQGMKYHHIHGAPVFWRSSKNGMNLYVWPERDFLREFHWNDSTALLECKSPAGVIETCRDGDSPVSHSLIQSPECFADLVKGCWSMPGGILSISADGDTAGTGIVWASMPKSDDALYNIVVGKLEALDADDITHELWSSEQNPTRDGEFMVAKYTPPVVANGRVYMATFGSIPNNGHQSLTGSVNVYGLRRWAKFIWDELASSQLRTLKPGQQFTDYAVFQNVGTTTWTWGMEAMGTQSPQDNMDWGTDRVDLPMAESVPVDPGQFVAFTLRLTAPRVPGTYTYQWRMVQENIDWFGDSMPSITITVAP
jgi:hypothetical protein